jgi:hypothetical protein
MNESFLAAGAVSRVKAWLAAFDTFGALKPRTVVPAHGAAGSGTLIASNRALVEGVRDRALALKAEGRSVDDAAAAVQKEFQEKHAGWPHANGIAGGGAGGI